MAIDPFDDLGFKPVTVPQSTVPTTQSNKDANDDPFAALGFKETTKAPIKPTVTEAFTKGLDTTNKILFPFATATKAIGPKVVNALTASTQKFGKSIGESFVGKAVAKKFQEVNDSYNEVGSNIQNAIAEKKKLGQDTSFLERTFQQHVQNAPKIEDFLPKDVSRRIQETKAQNIQEVGGEALGTAVESLSGGSLKSAFGALPRMAEGATKGKVVIQTAKDIAGALPTGYLSDVARGLSGDRGEDRTGSKAFIPGWGTGLSVGIPVVLNTTNEIIQGVQRSIPKWQSKAVDDLEQTYQDIMSGTTPGKKKLVGIQQKTEALNRSGTTGKTPERLLAEDGIIPNRTGAKLDTFEQAADYRKTIEPLREANKKALTEVSQSTQPLRLDDLEQKAIANAKTPKNVNSGRFEGMQKEIQARFNALRKAYPTGEVQLNVVDDIKSAHWDNVFGNKSLVESDKLIKDADYSIAKALQKEIENVAESAGNSQVAQLNREIGSRLDAAKFLEDLNGKTIKGGRLLKYITTLIGSSTGQTIPGKIVGALGGNAIGELMLSSQISNPAKRALLAQVKSQNPKAYTETINWLSKQNLDRETRLLLNAPSPLGSSKNPFIARAPLSGSTIIEKPAEVIRKYYTKI